MARVAHGSASHCDSAAASEAVWRGWQRENVCERSARPGALLPRSYTARRAAAMLEAQAGGAPPGADASSDTIL